MAILFYVRSIFKKEEISESSKNYGYSFMYSPFSIFFADDSILFIRRN